MKQLYKINGKYYEKFEDIPEKFRKYMDKDGNGIADIIEGNPNLKAGEKVRKISFEKHKPSKKENTNPNPHFHQNENDVLKKVLMVTLIAIVIGVLYIFLR